MQKNLYYRSVIRRDNELKKFIFSLFTMVARQPRLLLEVFIRKNFGERYFKLSSSCTVILILGLLPLVIRWTTRHPRGEEAPSLMSGYFLWYAFLAVFLAVSIRHHIATRRNPSVFDFAKYSLYSGDIHPAFFRMKFRGKEPDTRLVETIWEPLPFLIAGLLLWLIGQPLGTLLIVCSIVYSVGYMADYDAGDNFIMDRIDEIICNEELENAFVEDASESETRGISYRGRKPDSVAMRRKLMPLMIDEDEAIEAR